LDKIDGAIPQCCVRASVKISSVAGVGIAACYCISSSHHLLLLLPPAAKAAF